MSRVDKNLFENGHYLGRPADYTDRIITRRVELVKGIAGFCGKEFELVDLGCGNGASSFLLAPYMKHCQGIDIFDYHQKDFETYKKTHQIDNCDFMLLDIEQTLPEQKFDRLISFEVIEHLKDDNSVINYFKILRPGGMGAISVPNKWWIFETHGAKLPFLPWNRVPFFSWLPRFIHERFANARIYTKDRIRKVMEKAGFEVISMEYITAPMDVLPEGNLKRFLQRTLFAKNTTKTPFLSTAIFVVVKIPSDETRS